MDVVITGKPDVESIPAAAFSTYASYIITETKKFFGDPVNLAEFEAWRSNRPSKNGSAA